MSVCLLCCLGAAQQARAGDFELFGAGARGAAMGGAQAADAQDATALWYNPALLAWRQQPLLQLHLRARLPRLSLQRQEGSPGDAQGGRDSLLPDPSVQGSLGVVVPVARPWGRQLTLALLLASPVSEPPSVEATDPATPHFVLYQSLPRRLWVGAGAGLALGGGWSLGAGAQITSALAGRADVDLDTAQRAVVRRDLEASLKGDLGALLGLSWRQAQGPLRLGLSWRSQLAVPYRVPILFRFSEVGDLVFEIKGTALYTPDQWTLGGAWEQGPLTVAVDLTWARWSQAPSPAAQVRATLDDAGLSQEQQQDPSLLLDLRTLEASAGFVDTLQPRLGAQWRWSPRWASQAGYTLRPTPAPRQVGYTNWMDANSHQLGLGATWQALERTSLQGSTQLTLLTPRQASKDPSRDLLGLGDTRASGWSWSLGVQINQAL